MREYSEMGRFVLRNIVKATSLRRIDASNWSGYTLRALRPADTGSVRQLYAKSNRADMGRANEALLHLCGGRLCLVAEAADGSVAGFQNFYFNPRDLKENTVHEGYIAVAADHSSKGLATRMRRASLYHFGSQGLAGVSSRISVNNTASLVSARKLGFAPVETYADPSTGNRRYYMVAPLSPRNARGCW